MNALMVIEPSMAIEGIKRATALVTGLRKEVLRKDIDYGVIPGTNQKEVLLKPGAERLCSAFGFAPDFELIDCEKHWGDDGEEPRFFYQYRCKLINPADGQMIASGIGSCNSYEKKYRWRKSERVCPNCKKENIRKSKQGGWYCWAKTDGCGATFDDNDPQIVNQETGQKPNPDIFDQVNTIDKMAQKRALVAAVLIGCNASEFFSQDLEDMQTFGYTDGGVIEGEIVKEETTPAPASTDTEREIIMAFFTKWKREGLSSEEICRALGIKVVGDWKQGWGEVADQKVEQWMKGNDKPAAPKNGNGTKPAPTSQPTEEKPAKKPDMHYSLTDSFANFLSQWDLDYVTVLTRMGVKDWPSLKNINGKSCQSATEASEVIRGMAQEKCWPTFADQAFYKEANKKRFISFNTDLTIRVYSRQELVNLVGSNDHKWQAVTNWDLGAYSLPERIKIFPKKVGDNLVVDRIEIVKSQKSEDDDPFPWPESENGWEPKKAEEGA